MTRKTPVKTIELYWIRRPFRDLCGKFSLAVSLYRTITGRRIRIQEIRIYAYSLTLKNILFVQHKATIMISHVRDWKHVRENRMLSSNFKSMNLLMDFVLFSFSLSLCLSLSVRINTVWRWAYCFSLHHMELMARKLSQNNMATLQASFKAFQQELMLKSRLLFGKTTSSKTSISIMHFN